MRDLAMLIPEEGGCPGACSLLLHSLFCVPGVERLWVGRLRARLVLHGHFHDHHDDVINLAVRRALLDSKTMSCELLAAAFDDRKPWFSVHLHVRELDVLGLGLPRRGPQTTGRACKILAVDQLQGLFRVMT
jgi:hypothetical protein